MDVTALLPPDAPRTSKDPDAAATTGGQSKDEGASRLLDAWKKTVDVQMHFNDIELRTRNLALTVLAAAVAAVGFLARSQSGAGAAGPQPYPVHLELFGVDVPLQPAIFGAALAMVAAFWIMDRHWYHRFLVGAVRAGIALEEQLRAKNLDVGLASAIRAESAIHFFGRTTQPGGGLRVATRLFHVPPLPWLLRGRELQSYGRVDLFYLILASLCLVGIAASLSGLWKVIPLGLAAYFWCLWWENSFTKPGEGY